MPLTRSTEDLSIAEDIERHCCQEIFEPQLLIASCGHQFHNVCFRTKVANKKICPVCKQQPILSEANSSEDLNTNVQQPSGSKTSKRIPPTPIAIQTRSKSKQITEDLPVSSFRMSKSTENSNINIEQEDQALPSQNIMDGFQRAIAESIAAAMAQQNANLLAAMRQQTEILSQAIANNATTTVSPESRSSNAHIQTLPAVEQQRFEQLLRSANKQPQPPTTGSDTQNRYTPSNSDIRPDRISQIMANWKIRFSGKGPLSVDDFIYRVEALTSQTLDADFQITARYASNLFEGVASDWYWRYHKSVVQLNWVSLCSALRGQFKDARTDRDIRTEIELRKQRHNESFDDFYGVIASLADKLSIPMHESALVETLRANLLPEIQLEILYESANSIAQLRHLVRKREIFMQMVAKPQINKPRPIFRQTDHAVDASSETELQQELLQEDFEIDAINLTCWYCKASGHRYQECTAERRVFCYGCGRADTYKPKCTYCSSKNAAQRAPLKSARKQMTSKSTNTE